MNICKLSCQTYASCWEPEQQEHLPYPYLRGLLETSSLDKPKILREMACTHSYFEENTLEKKPVAYPHPQLLNLVLYHLGYKYTKSFQTDILMPLFYVKKKKIRDHLTLEKRPQNGKLRKM